jgi:hypothetical protein
MNGPWQIKTRKGEPLTIVDADGLCICIVGFVAGSERQQAQTLQRARLIASAPDLYDALADCVYELRGTETHMDCILVSTGDMRCELCQRACAALARIDAEAQP